MLRIVVEILRTSLDHCHADLHMQVHLLQTFKIVVFDVAIVTRWFWHFVKYITFIAIGHTVLLILLEFLIGRILVHLR